MEYIHQTENFQFHNSAVALGKFDGLHRGHQLIFDQLLEYKKQRYQTVVFSFDRPPVNTLKSENYHMIYSKEEKERLLAKKGMRAGCWPPRSLPL